MIRDMVGFYLSSSYDGASRATGLLTGLVAMWRHFDGRFVHQLKVWIFAGKGVTRKRSSPGNRSFALQIGGDAAAYEGVL